MLNRPAQNFRAAQLGFVMCLVLAGAAGMLLILPEDPRHKSPPANPQLFGALAAIFALGAVVLAFTAVSLRRKARRYLGSELRRTGARFYDVGFATLSRVGIGGQVILSRDNLYFVIPPPMSSGLIGGMADQAKWDAIVPITSEYTDLPAEILNDSDWPRIGKMKSARVMIVPKAQVGSVKMLANKRGAELTTPLGNLQLGVDPFSRELVQKRFGELQWTVP